MHRATRAWALVLLAWLAVATPAAAQRFPKLTGLVVDEANVIPPADEAALETKLEALQRDTGRQLVVATIADVQGYALDDYGVRLGRAWGVGLKDADNGAVLFIAPNNPAGQRGPRLEVGYGLEPILTDAWSGRLMRDTMVPRLKAGDVPGAMSAGADAVIAQLRRSPDEAKAQTDAAIARFDRTQSRSRYGGGFPIALVFWLVVLGVVVAAMARGRRRKGPWGRRRRSSGLGDVVLWGIANEMMRGSGRGSGWGGGGGSSSGGGGGWMGGGFTGGGGGSFGGGGASGDW